MKIQRPLLSLIQKQGRWDVEVVNTEGLGEVTYFATRDSDAPTIEIIEPSQTVPGGEVEIVFDAFDADSEANISLFYDDDGEGFDGVQIVDGLIEQDGRSSYTWNTAGVATGEYHIYAIALDDTNAPAFSYSPGTVQITQAADLSVTQAVDTETIDVRESQTYTITVTNNGEDTATGVVVDYTLPEGATFVDATLEPSAQSEDETVQFTVGNLAPDESTTIEVSINTSNILGEALANTVVTSDSYDPDITNNIADTITTVTNNGLPVVAIPDVSAIEGNDGNTSLTFTVSLSTETTEAFSIEYSTEDLTAFAGEDYTATEGVLEFAPGELEKTITIDILGDTNLEEDEIFGLTFNSLDDNFVLTKPRAIGTIQTDDGDTNPDPIIDDLTGETVYRFFNPSVGVHFYTASTAERDAVQELSNYVFEGESYETINSDIENAEDVYRFFNTNTGVHLYTTDENERDSIIENLPEFTFEGTAFSAYETEVEGTIPIYRFFNGTTGAHFYTPSVGERDSVEENLPDFQLEGIAYYASPLSQTDV